MPYGAQKNAFVLMMQLHMKINHKESTPNQGLPCHWHRVRQCAIGGVRCGTPAHTHANGLPTTRASGTQQHTVGSVC